MRTSDTFYGAIVARGREDMVRTSGTFYRATLETAHFTFEAYGADGLQAMALLRRVLEVHAKQTGADWAWLLLCWDEVEPQPFDIGRAYRDGMEVRS